MCDYDTHYCKHCHKDYECSHSNATCPTLNRYVDANICHVCDFDQNIEEAIFNATKDTFGDHIGDEEFDVEKKD